VEAQTSKPLDLSFGDVLIHKKGGAYRVLDTDLTHSETGEPMVSYQAQYGTEGKWVRPKSMFTEDRFRIIIKGKQVARW
jgi:hypothetical protein